MKLKGIHTKLEGEQKNLMLVLHSWQQSVGTAMNINSLFFEESLNTSIATRHNRSPIEALRNQKVSIKLQLGYNIVGKRFCL